MSQNIYAKIGGAAAVATVVVDFYEHVLNDSSVSHYFDDIDMAALINHQTNFVAKALGGPEVYEGRDLLEAHAGRKITEAAFSSIAGHLQTALLAAGVGSEDTDTIIGIVASLKDQVVDSPTARVT